MVDLLEIISHLLFSLHDRRPGIDEAAVEPEQKPAQL